MYKRNKIKAFTGYKDTAEDNFRGFRAQEEYEDSDQ